MSRATLTGALVALAVALCTTGAALAAPVTPTFTTIQTAPLTITFDATATACPWGFCSYTWKGYGATTNRLGFQMGDGQRITYRFPAAGDYRVVLTVGVTCSRTSHTSCPASTTSYLSLT